MSDAYRVELRTVDGGPTAIGSAGPFTLIADRPAGAGRGGLELTAVELRHRTVRGR